MRVSSREPDEGASIDATLRAEHDAEVAVEHARQEARGLVEAARTEARAIRERTDQRIARLYAATSASIERQVRTLHAEAAEQREQLSKRSQDPEIVRLAVARVVPWLLGEGS